MKSIGYDVNYDLWLHKLGPGGADKRGFVIMEDFDVFKRGSIVSEEDLKTRDYRNIGRLLTLDRVRAVSSMDREFKKEFN